MTENKSQIYLASKSPRRRELLDQIGVSYTVIETEVSEIPVEGESAADFVTRIAADKARVGWNSENRKRDIPVLGADTAVVLEDRIFGKPDNREDAIHTLSALSARRHEVLTSVSLCQDNRLESVLSRSHVFFREINQSEMRDYWDSGEPADKAGAYGIQGLGALFVNRLDGSYSGVMGLPLFETGQLLARFGIRVPGPG